LPGETVITEQQGRKRAGELYSATQQRARKALEDPAYKLPYTRQQFGDWLMQHVGLLIIRCPYCCLPLDILSVSVDHKRPLSRGGAFTLENLMAVCLTCNRAKGDLTAEEFMSLVNLTQTWHPTGANLLAKLLKDGLMQNAQRIQAWKRKRVEETRDAF
jgi:5-methylcytosine-specific restriction endonuclease McrA